jgi:MurNAc alpha-1-phosphate uridylyltransferase
MKAMVLAAGRGERMAALTARRPKPLLEVGGRSLIERHIDRLARAGISEVVINISYRGEQIRARLGDGRRWGVTIRYSDEGEPPLETGGGIVNALPLLGAAPFLLVNADVVTDFDPAELMAEPGADTLLLVPNPPHHPNGDFGLDSSGYLTAAAPRLTYAGIAALDPALFSGLPPMRRALKPILDAAIERHALRGLRYDGLWLDVGTPARLEQARAALRALPEELRGGAPRKGG